MTAAAAGLDVLVIEKQALIGGSTAISGGVIWLPNNPLMQAEGVPDSFEEGMAYFESVVGDVGPASSPARRAAFITEGAKAIRLLQDQGVSFVRCEGYSDYHADVAAFVGGKARGRSIEATVFDGRELGPWLTKMPPSSSRGVVVMTGEAARLQLARRSLAGAKVAGRVALRTAGARLKGEERLANGRALIGQTLRVAIRQEVTLWTQTAFVDLLVEDGRVVGLVANRHGRRYQGDVTNRPNACLGPLDKPPFYAVEIYPGDVGTSGGLLCDEFSRVLGADRQPIPGLYATGNCTASVMGRVYPGAGASIGATFVFAYIAMRHAVQSAAGDLGAVRAAS